MNMENYASDDPGPAFLIGHHETNRSMPVTTDTIFKVHESNVSSQSSSSALSNISPPPPSIVDK